MSLPTFAQSSGDATNHSARRHLENGGRYYHLRRYNDAAREFQAAYDLSRRPELLFNLGRALESGGRDREALDAYERFAAVGSPGIDPATLRDRIAALHVRVPTATTPTTPIAPIAPIAPTLPIAPTVAVRAPTAVTRTPASPLDRPAPSRNIALPVALISAGGAFILTGLALGLTVSSTYSNLEARCPGRVCDPALQSDANAASTRAVVGDVLGGLGLAALVAGVVVWLLPRSHSDSRAPRVGLACTGDGCVGHVAVAF